MAAEVIRVSLPPKILKLTELLDEARIEALEEAGDLLLFEIRAAIRQRAYRTGRLHGSVKLDRLGLKRGLLAAFSDVPYAVFIERGWQRTYPSGKHVKVAPRRPFEIGRIRAQARITELLLQKIAEKI